MNKYKVTGVTCLLAAVLMLSGWTADLVAKVAMISFEALVKSVPGGISYDDSKESWSVEGLDGNEKLVLSRDFKSPNPDSALEFDADPFLKAGLDVSELPGNYHYNKLTGWITMTYEYGNDKFGAESGKSISGTFEKIVATHRDLISYHDEGDHYMMTMGSGNIFAWAKDMGTNTKDMVFILNPKPLIDAGVDVGKLKGWAYAKVPLMDKDGRSVLVNKFVKSFSIK